MELTRKMVIEQNLIDSEGHCIIPEGITVIGRQAFINCILLKSVTIPNHIKKISNWSFENCLSLKNIDISDSVKEIGMGAFKGCTSLVSIIIPNGIIKIESYVFRGCVSLENVTISNNVIEIDIDAFYNCTSLTNINMPNSINKIDYDAFYGCKSLPPLGIGKQLLNKVIENNNFRKGLCYQFGEIISDLKLPTNTENELPMFTKKNAIMYANGVNNGYWFTTREDRKNFVHWMLKQLNE